MNEEIPEEKSDIAEEEEIKPKRKFKFNFELFKKISYGVLGLAVIIAAYIFFTSTGGWEVIQFSGKPTLNNSAISKCG